MAAQQYSHEAMAELDRQVALYEAGATDGRTINVESVFRCAEAVVETAPTTPAGLRALSDHLRQSFGFGSWLRPKNQAAVRRRMAWRGRGCRRMADTEARD